MTRTTIGVPASFEGRYRIHEARFSGVTNLTTRSARQSASLSGVYEGEGLEVRAGTPRATQEKEGERKRESRVESGSFFPRKVPEGQRIGKSSRREDYDSRGTSTALSKCVQGRFVRASNRHLSAEIPSAKTGRLADSFEQENRGAGSRTRSTDKRIASTGKR